MMVQDRASEARAIISDSTLDVLKVYDLFYSLRLCDFINYETRDFEIALSQRQGVQADTPEHISFRMLMWCTNQQVNWTTGETVAVGKPLAASGFKLELCAPSAIDPTGKWIYTLARPVHDGASSTWHALDNNSNALAQAANTTVNTTAHTLLAMELADGTVHTTRQPLPAEYFDPKADACAHALATDGGWNAYVTAVVGMGATARLRTVQMSALDWPGQPPPPPPKLIADVAVAKLGLGDAASTPTGTIDSDNVMWVTLSGGAAGLSLDTGAYTSRVPVPDGSALTALQGFGTVYGLLTNSDGHTVVASFDPGVTPTLRAGTVVVPGPVAHGATAAALLSDKQGIALITESGHLVTTDLDGRSVSTAPACKGAEGCPAAINYEPFVFSA